MASCVRAGLQGRPQCKSARHTAYMNYIDITAFATPPPRAQSRALQQQLHAAVAAAASSPQNKARDRPPVNLRRVPVVSLPFQPARPAAVDFRRAKLSASQIRKPKTSRQRAADCEGAARSRAPGLWGFHHALERMEAL